MRSCRFTSLFPWRRFLALTAGVFGVVAVLVYVLVQSPPGETYQAFQLFTTVLVVAAFFVSIALRGARSTSS